MNTYVETDNQQPSVLNQDEGSETIPQGSREATLEAVSILPSNVEDKDIVQNQNKRFIAFVEKANKKHNSKFDYSKFVYINAKTKSIITCPDHGEFFQNPDKHLNSEHACPECWGNIRKENFDRDKGKITKIDNKKQSFIVESHKKYGNKFLYDLSSYSMYTSGKIRITCPIHGDFYSTPVAHMICETGCPKCGLEKKNKSKTKGVEDFLSKAKETHNDSYSYPDIETYYKSRKTIITVVCKSHGKFKLSAQKHLAGRRCPRCNIEDAIKNNKLVGGYSEDLFNLKPELKTYPAKLYYLSINDGEFYKIGITRTSMSFRIKGIKAKARMHGQTMYSVEILHTVDTTLYDAFKQEQSIIQNNLESRQITKWSTELFNKDIKPFN